jgi:hypothetical protein
MMNFKEWLKINEMAGVATIINPKKDCKNPDFQVWGAVCKKSKKK